MNNNVMEVKVKVSGSDKAAQDVDKFAGKVSQSTKKATKDISEWGIATKAVMANLAVEGAQFLGRELASTVGEFFNFEEGLVSVRKTVGFTKEEMKTFGDQILEIGADSRTSYDELLNIATIGGQLGISKGEILDFTFAIDKLNVALGDEFLGGASEITDSVGGLNLIFREFKGRPMADGLLLIGNALNKLGAEGMATAPIVSEFARRIAGSAVPLGMTAADILGLSAALQELQVAPERGSSTITRVMAEMGKNIDDFAKVAGKSSAEFAEIYNTDVNEALLLVAKGIRENSSNNVELIETLDELGVDGVFATEVLGKLGENIDFVRGKQELANVALQDSNSIMDEYNLRNETGQAAVDKLGQKFERLKIQIGEALAPLLLEGVDFLYDA
jgi:TP901 family phage tail tape measure protein